MLGKSKKQPRRHSSVRPDSTFKRNNAALSSSQREQRARQQAQTDRQLSLQQKIEKHRRRLRLYLFIALLVFLLLGYRLMVGGVTIESVNKVPSEKQQEYAAFIQKTMLENSVARQVWTVDKQALSTAVQSEFGEVQSITLNQVALLQSNVKAELTFREPVFIWKDASKNTRYLDKNGILFDQNYTDVNTKELPLIEDESGLVFDAGTTVVSKKTQEFIGALPAVMGRSSLPGIKSPSEYNKITIPQSVRELYVYPKNTAYFIKLETSRGVEQQVSELSSLLKFLKKKNITPSKYVDIRLEGKAFYK